MRKQARYLTAIILAATALSCTKQKESAHLMPGEAMPPFLTYTTEGVNVGDETLKGQPSLVILFDTRCPDCRKELPEAQHVFDVYGDRMRILAIAREEEAAGVKSFWEGMGLTMPVAAPGNRDIYNIFDRNSLSGVPQVYLFDKNGTCIAYYDDKNLLSFDEFTSRHAEEILLDDNQ